MKILYYADVKKHTLAPYACGVYNVSISAAVCGRLHRLNFTLNIISTTYNGTMKKLS